MILRYDFGGGGLRLLDGEHLEVFRTGAFELWRLHRSPLVGRFAGHLDAAALARLRRLVDAAAAASAGTPPPSPGSMPELVLPPGGRAERWIANETVLEVPEAHVPPGPWGALIAEGRAMLDGLTSRPLAAVELTVADDWHTATLHHRGRDALAVDPATLEIEVAAWRGYYDLVGTWASGSRDLGTASIGPGWSMELELRHRFRTGKGRVLHVSAGFEVLVGDARTRLKAEVAPPMEPPAEAGPG